MDHLEQVDGALYRILAYIYTHVVMVIRHRLYNYDSMWCSSCMGLLSHCLYLSLSFVCACACVCVCVCVCVQERPGWLRH